MEHSLTVKSFWVIILGYCFLLSHWLFIRHLKYYNVFHYSTFVILFSAFVSLSVFTHILCLLEKHLRTKYIIIL